MDTSKEQTMETTTIEHFQTGSAAQAINTVIAAFEAKNPDRQVAYAEFDFAYPGDRDGRWVGIRVHHDAR